MTEFRNPKIIPSSVTPGSDRNKIKTTTTTTTTTTTKKELKKTDAKGKDL